MKSWEAREKSKMSTISLQEQNDRDQLQRHIFAVRGARLYNEKIIELKQQLTRLAAAPLQDNQSETTLMVTEGPT